MDDEADRTLARQARSGVGRRRFSSKSAVEMCRHGFVHGQVEVFNQADEDFHAGVAAASRNTFLVEAVREARRLQR
ncbi:FCD domain-containing protein [Streptomyces europaeiscabiei]|uniref:FCD domain-containing protein n=1 Tax=Streptomyces europaeiscabiei TaxID=146819 RepID=UPI003866BD9F